MTELMKDQRSSYFRGNVGVVLINNDGQILNACRKGFEDSWQMPQGGINEGEEPIEAAKRELSEELGLNEQRLARLVEYVCEHPLWLGYQLPKFTSKHGRGQVQKWFLFRFIGNDSDIEAAFPKSEEFDKWRWATKEDVIRSVWKVKRSLYKEVFRTFSEYLQ